MYPTTIMDIRSSDPKIRLEAYDTRGWTKAALKDSVWYIRSIAYERFGYTVEAYKDASCQIRLEAFIQLGWTDDSLGDENNQIRRLSRKHFKTKVDLNHYLKIVATKFKSLLYIN